MVKAHTPINWENKPSTNTPINETNLNKMDSTIGILDDRIIAQDTTKLDKSTANTMVKDVTFAENTGIFTITYLNGSTKTLDTKLEKIATNFKYDYSTQTLILTLIDGTAQSIDMSALVTQYEFADSATLDFSVDSSGKVTATIKNGSITESMLEPNYLANIKVETAKSQQSMANAQTSENNAKNSANLAQSYAVGGTGTRDGEDTDNAKYYSENAKPVAQTITGSNPTATNSTQAPVIYMKNSGYTEQNTLSGKNLLEMNTTNFALTDNGIKNNVQGGAMGTVDLKAGVTYSLSLLLFSKPTADTSFVSKINNVDIGDFSFVTIDTYNLNEKFTRTYTATEDCTVSIGMYGNANVETIKFQLQLEEGSTATDYEPYCGCTASPNPDYPQRIGGLADKGYFDGVLQQGYYADELTIDTTSTSAVCSKNPIPCKEGDTIKVVHEVSDTTIDNKFDVVFLDSDKNYLSVQTSFTNLSDDVATAPTNAKYFLFSIRRSGYELSPSTAKHIYVTINGMYAVAVKTVGKNLLRNTATTKTINGITFTVNDDGSVTINGTATDNTNLNFSGSIDLTNTDAIGSLLLLSGTVSDKSGVRGYVYDSRYWGHALLVDTETQLENYNYSIFRLSVSSGVTCTNVKLGMMIRLATITDSTYEPYTETQALIPISSPLYDGDYIEVYADGSGQIYRDKSRKKIEAWNFTKTGTYVDRYYHNYTSVGLDVDTGRYSEIKCNAFTWASTAETVGLFTSNTTSIGFAFAEKDTSTLEDFQTYLTDNEVYIIYPLAEPTTESLTAEQVAELKKLQTFNEVTHITADGEVTVRYYCNTDSGDTVGMLHDMVESNKADLQEQIDKVGEINVSITTDFTVRHCKCRKQGNVVTLSLDLKLGCDCSKDTVLATLGEDARPSGSFSICAMGLIDEDGNNLVPAMFSIWTDGTIHQNYGDNVWLEQAVLHVSYVVE